MHVLLTSSISFGRPLRSNKDDPFLAGDDCVYNEQELDELRLRHTDALLVARRCGEEARHLEYYMLDAHADDSDDETECAPNVV